MKNSIAAFVGLLVSVAATDALAALPPKYLEVEDFQQCLAVEQVSSFSVWCMPAEKPELCHAQSWVKLLALSGSDKLPDCPAETVAPLPPVQP